MSELIWAGWQHDLSVMQVIQLPSLVQIMAWCQTGTKPLSEQMLDYCQLDLLKQYQWKLNENTTFIQETADKKINFKILFVKCQPFCLCLTWVRSLHMEYTLHLHYSFCILVHASLWCQNMSTHPQWSAAQNSSVKFTFICDIFSPIRTSNLTLKKNHTHKKPQYAHSFSRF